MVGVGDAATGLEAGATPATAITQAAQNHEDRVNIGGSSDRDWSCAEPLDHLCNCAMARARREG
jgi:hypothetical protein